MLIDAFSEDFKTSLLKFMEEGLRSQYHDYSRDSDEIDTTLRNGETLTELLSFRDYTHRSGYCETCYYETTYCRLTAKTSEDRVARYIYTEDFSYLIRELTEEK